MAFSSNQICSLLLLLVLVCGFILNLSSGHEGHHSSIHETHVHHHHCNHHGDHLHNHDLHHLSHEERIIGSKKLPEELAEEEDLKLYGFGSHLDHEHHHDDHAASDLSGLGLWINAIGCSLLVSMASLVCLIILPVIFIHGKPSNAVVDSLALFGAGAMLGDAFLHQLPHAFGGEHSHSHDHNEHAHDHVDFGHQHSHSLKDLSVGLSILAGIVLFLLVEKVVRYVDEMSGGANEWSHSHHHHHHNHHHENNKKLKDDNDAHGNAQQQSVDEKNGSITEIPSEGEVLNGVSDECLSGRKRSQPESLRKRNVATGADEDEPNLDAAIGSTKNIKSLNDKEPARSPSNLVFGYLNLFSDGVHNFTDGMALGSAFLLYGSVGGWSRTLFLLAHELPQEIGDFGILVRSGFSVSKALFFNFLSALVALGGTGLALLLGHDPGYSALIEGFTAGGFIYVAVAGVLAETNNGSSALKSTAIQLTSLILGMAVALCISLVE